MSISESNEYYHFAANKGIHPTYVQTLLADKRYKDSDFFGVLQNVSESNASSFSPESLKSCN